MDNNAINWVKHLWFMRVLTTALDMSNEVAKEWRQFEMQICHFKIGSYNDFKVDNVWHISNIW